MQSQSANPKLTPPATIRHLVQRARREREQKRQQPAEQQPSEGMDAEAGSIYGNTSSPQYASPLDMHHEPSSSLVGTSQHEEPVTVSELVVTRKALSPQILANHPSAP